MATYETVERLTTPNRPMREARATPNLVDACEAKIEREFRRDADESYGLSTQTMLSFIVPVKDEQHTLFKLRELIAANVPREYDFEIVIVDDGSSDSSWDVIEQLVAKYPSRVRGLRFRHNAGKAAALTAGFRAACGDIVFTIDADLQDDPREIPRFLDKLNEGFDLVSGWKRVRHDPWHKVIPSRVFNWMTSFFGCVKLHDHNCGFKCYRACLAKQLTLHGELHRMVPSLAAMRGFRSGEIEVRHHPRRFGRTKYGVERFARGFSDMLTIGFLQRFRERPAHFMNAIASIYAAVGLTVAIAGVVSSGLSGLILVMAGLIFGGMAGAVFLIGLISELVIRGELGTLRYLPIVEDTVQSEGPPHIAALKGHALAVEIKREAPGRRVVMESRTFSRFTPDVAV